jgi:TnpA family transposase
MVQDEGLVNTASFMFKWLSDRRVRRRMRATFAFFGQNKAYIAYGIYVGERGSGAEEAIRAAQHL